MRKTNSSGKTWTLSCSTHSRDNGAGFQHDTNKITIIDAHKAQPYPLKTKKEVATDIIDRLCMEFVSQQ